MRRVCSVMLSLLVTIFTLGCGSHRLVQCQSHDSVRVEVVHREVVVRDTVVVELPHIEKEQTVSCDTSVLESDYARSEARILPHGELYHTLSTLSSPIAKPVEMRVALRDSIIYRERLVREVVEVERELSWWQNFSIYGFYVLLALWFLRLKF